MNKLAEEIVVQILKSEMSLPNGTIWVRDQNRDIPKGDGLYVIVGFVDANVVSVVNTVEPYTFTPPNEPNPVEAMIEKQQILQAETIQIDLVSRSNASLLRRWEVLAALRSVLSQQKQDENCFKIARIPTSFINASDAEGSSQLNRFSLAITAHVWYQKDKVLYSPTGGDYYNDFTTRVDDATTIDQTNGLIEFEITEGA